jgi:hypothetical protein
MTLELNALRMALEEWQAAEPGPDREHAAQTVARIVNPGLLVVILRRLDDALDRLDIIRDRDRRTAS